MPARPLHTFEGHVDYQIYKWNENRASQPPGDRYCARVFTNANTPPNAPSLLKALCYGDLEPVDDVEVVVLDDVTILEIKWPGSKKHNLRSNADPFGWGRFANSNMTLRKALRVVKKFDFMLGAVLPWMQD